MADDDPLHMAGLEGEVIETEVHKRKKKNPTTNSQRV